MPITPRIRSLCFVLIALAAFTANAANQNSGVSTDNIPSDCAPLQSSESDWKPGLRITQAALSQFLSIPSSSCRKQLILLESDDAVLSQVAIRDSDSKTRHAAFSRISDSTLRITVLQQTADPEIGRSHLDSQPPRDELETIRETAKSVCVRNAALLALDRITWWDVFGPAAPGKKNSTEKLQDAVCTARVFGSRLNSVYGYAKSYAISVIKAGDSTKFSGLNDILKLFGDKDLAMLYVNSGKTELHVQAVVWAEQNGYKIAPFGGKSEATWGRKE